jgi:hypothetical protein
MTVTVDDLLSAALAYGEAWQKYSNKYKAWDEKHPAESREMVGRSPHESASWVEEVLPSCSEATRLGTKLHEVAKDLYGERKKDK